MLRNGLSEKVCELLCLLGQAGQADEISLLLHSSFRHSLVGGDQAPAHLPLSQVFQTTGHATPLFLDLRPVSL